jgi:hypothetical protein
MTEVSLLQVVTTSQYEPMECLSDELLSTVLGWVPPIDLLRSTVRVNKRFAALIESEEFWRHHPLAPTESKSWSLTKHQLQRCCLYGACAAKTTIESSSSSSPPPQVPEFLQRGSVVASRTEAERLRQSGPFRVCAASTTDHLREAIENVLSDGTFEVGLTDEDYLIGRNFWLLRRGRLCWWSSQPSRVQESNDVLLFTTQCPLTLLLEVKIKPLRDPYLLLQREGVFYTWQKTVIRAYRLPLESLADPGRPPILSGFPCMFRSTGTQEDPWVPLQPQQHPQPQQPLLLEDGPAAPPEQETIDHLLAGHVPVYESQEYDVPADSNETMRVVLPFGVVANVVTITLIGKNNEQRIGRGYYACVENVDCVGIPLYSYPDQAGDVAAARACLREEHTNANQEIPPFAIGRAIYF